MNGVQLSRQIGVRSFSPANDGGAFHFGCRGSRTNVYRSDLCPLSPPLVEDRLQTTDRVTRALMTHGHMRTLTVVNPVNRCPTVAVPVTEVRRFEREFVSLFAIARKELQHAGVEPAYNPRKIGATFYRRTDVENEIRT
jgi:hypothetical protein